MSAHTPRMCCGRSLHWHMCHSVGMCVSVHQCACINVGVCVGVFFFWPLDLWDFNSLTRD